MRATARRAYDRLALRVGVLAMLSALRLDNGLTVVHAARPGPVVAIEVWIGAGTADEPAAAPGVAHAVEHLLFRAAGGAAPSLAAAIQRLGGDVNAWTAFDHTVVHAAVPVDATPAAIGALAHAVIRPPLGPDELDAERGVLAAELRDLAGDPARTALRAVFRQLFLVHPYRRPVGGTQTSLARLGALDLEAFFSTWYVAGNTVIAVVGDELARVGPAIARAFDAMAARPVVRAPRGEPAQTELRAAVMEGRAAGGAAHLALGLRTAGAGDPDRDALEVLAAALAPDVAATHHVFRDGGALVATATGRPPIARAADAFAAQLAALAALDDPAVARAVAALDAAALRAAETAAGAARSLGAISAELDVARRAADAVAPAIAAAAQARVDRRRRLTSSHVRAIARDRLRPEQLAVAALSPRRASARPVADAVRRRLGSSTSTSTSASRSTSTSTSTSKRRIRSVVRHELANGLVVLVLPDPDAPIVAMRALWAGGARLEDDESAGATALLARAITRGCGDRDAAAMAAEVADAGGVLAGTAGKNGFGLRAEWPARHWPRGLGLVADCIVDPRLAAEDVADARREQLAQIATAHDDPARAAVRLFSQALYGDHPYRLDPLGTEESVAGITPDVLAALHRDRHAISRLVLAVVGDVDPDAVIAAVERRFAAAARPRRLVAPIDPPVLDGRPAADREVYAYRAGGEAQVVIGFPGARVDGADRHAVAVLAAVLDGPAGRIFAELRDRRGLAYRIGVHAVDGVDPGYLAIHVACAPADAGAVVAAVREELDRLAGEGPGTDDVERARAALIGAHTRATERRADVAHGLAFAEAHGTGFAAYLAYPDAIAAVTVADVAAAARRTLRWDRAVIATVRPPAATPAAARRTQGKTERAPAVKTARKRRR
jgi:zinc protease